MSNIGAERVPSALVDAILRGRCIAFVGAGFSQPAVPAWSALLDQLAQRLGVDVKLSGTPNALELELIGQALRRAAGSPQRFEREIQAILDEHDRTDTPEAHRGRRIVKERRRLLGKIPFKAILTTNFDGWVSGQEASADTYRRVLRETQGRWWEFPLTAQDRDLDVPVIKLHGDANGNPAVAPVVLGRSDYRERLYGEHGYANFLRAAFAGYTVLFLGVSFTDAYLNELRSETLHLLHGGDGHRAPPWGYAIMNFTPESQHLADLYRQHEGLEVLETTEHAQFDEWLAAITARTSIEGRLRELLGGKHIVWLDANVHNNARGRAFFETCGATVERLTSETQLEPRHQDASLLVTHFGHDAATGDSRAFRVLDQLRAWPNRPPVIVFASHHAPVAENRRQCLRRGAWEYATAWSELYGLIDVLFARRPEMPQG